MPRSIREFLWMIRVGEADALVKEESGSKAESTTPPSARGKGRRKGRTPNRNKENYLRLRRKRFAADAATATAPVADARQI